jgi:hypothetical protein
VNFIIADPAALLEQKFLVHQGKKKNKKYHLPSNVPLKLLASATEIVKELPNSPG